MIHSSRRDRKTKAIAAVLAMIADVHPPIDPHRPHPVLDAEEWLFESAIEFFEALDKYYAEHATQMVLPHSLLQSCLRRQHARA